MHPPLFQQHPLCSKEVEEFVRCHTEHPFMKFLNKCGELESSMNVCFREEKKLRRKLSYERDHPISAGTVVSVRRPADIAEKGITAEKGAATSVAAQ